MGLGKENTGGGGDNSELAVNFYVGRVAHVSGACGPEREYKYTSKTPAV